MHEMMIGTQIWICNNLDQATLLVVFMALQTMLVLITLLEDGQYCLIDHDELRKQKDSTCPSCGIWL